MPVSAYTDPFSASTSFYSTPRPIVTPTAQSTWTPPTTGQLWPRTKASG